MCNIKDNPAKKHGLHQSFTLAYMEGWTYDRAVTKTNSSRRDGLLYFLINGAPLPWKGSTCSSLIFKTLSVSPTAVLNQRYTARKSTNGATGRGERGSGQWKTGVPGEKILEGRVRTKKLNPHIA